MIEQWQPASSQTSKPDSDTLLQLLAALPQQPQSPVIDRQRLDDSARAKAHTWTKRHGRRRWPGSQPTSCYRLLLFLSVPSNNWKIGNVAAAIRRSGYFVT